MKIVIGQGTCAGHAGCFTTSPDLFVLDDSG